MTLPIHSSPTHTLTIPSTGKKLKYRPFLVKEEKALMLAEQSEDINQMVETLKSIVESCTFGKAKTDSLAIFDLEYILLKLRSKSVGETTELRVHCQSCKKPTDVTCDISKLEVKHFDGHSTKIPLFDDVGVVLKYPTIDILSNLKDEYDELELDAVIECVDFVYDADTIYHKADQSKEELENFLVNLSREQFRRIEKFFDTMPVLELELKFTCPFCQHENEMVIREIQNFF